MWNKLKDLSQWVDFFNIGSAALLSAVVYGTTWEIALAFATFVAVITATVNLKLFIKLMLEQALQKAFILIDRAMYMRLERNKRLEAIKNGNSESK